MGVLIGMLAGALLALVHGVFCIHLRADQIVVGTAIIFLAYGITGFLYNDIYGDQGTPGDLPRIPDVNLDWLGSIPPADLGRFLEESFGDVSVMTLGALGLVFVSYVVLFKTPLGLRIRACGEHPRAADTVGINVYVIRYSSVILSGALAALGGVFLSIGYNGSFTEKMTAGYGFIALAALIFGNWRPFGILAAALLFGFANALAPELENVEAWASYATLFAALPYVLTLDRRGRRHRPDGPAGRRRSALRQAMTAMELPQARNPRATASLAVGVTAVAVVPIAIAASRFFDELTLVRACASAALAAALGLFAIVLARRGRETAQRTLGRSGGEGAARVGRWLGLIAIWLAATTGLALAFYGLLTLFAD